MMRKLIIGCVLGVSMVGVVYAGCFTNTVITPDGQLLVCTTCCDNGMCTTNCTQ